MVPKYAHGGIGDLLLCLQSAIEAHDIEVYSHFAQAADIFTHFGVNVYRFDYFKNNQESMNLYKNGEQLRRDLFPEFPVPFAPFPKQNAPVIGIHIEGSHFSNMFWAERGLPTKNMTDSFILRLVADVQRQVPGATIYLFCAPALLYQVGSLVAETITGEYNIIAFPKIWDSLACVEHCDFMIGMDSCMKTMSAIRRIPTVTLVGNYADSYRDDTFLLPYVKEGVMTVVPFDIIDEVDTGSILQYVTL